MDRLHRMEAVPMADSVSLSRHLLDRSRHFHHLGQTANARTELRRVLNLPELAAAIRSDAHRLFGQLEMESGRFRPARRHLALAIRLCPHHADTCYRYATAVEADIDGNLRRAWRALRMAIDLDAYEPRYWTLLGRISLRMGRTITAIKAFRRAARLDPENVPILSEVVEGLTALGRVREAAKVLRVARFRAPHDSRIIGLMNRFQFDGIRRRQVAARHGSFSEPAVLPFPGRISSGSTDASPSIVRVDRPSLPQPHLLRMFGSQPDPRQAR